MVVIVAVVVGVAVGIMLVVIGTVAPECGGGDSRYSSCGMIKFSKNVVKFDRVKLNK